MREDIEQRARDLALYIVENNATVRDAALHFRVSKSTVHIDVMVQNGLSGSYAERAVGAIRRLFLLGTKRLQSPNGSLFA